MKKFRNLSLILAGFALGVTVAYSPQIHAAASSLLGSKVGKVLNVKVNNKSIGSGAVINGSTYVPLRAAANAMGMEVASVDTKEVNLVSAPDDTGTIEPAEPTETAPAEDLSEKAKAEQEQLNKKTEEINVIETKINDTKQKISDAENFLSDSYKELAAKQIQTEKQSLEIFQRMFDADPSEANKALVDGSKSRIDKFNSNIKSAETNLPSLKQQLSDLEAQLAALHK